MGVGETVQTGEFYRITNYISYTSYFRTIWTPQIFKYFGRNFFFSWYVTSVGEEGKGTKLPHPES